MNESFLVSIIISSFNYDGYLRTAIDSALRQSYKNKEVIVVDDGSTDNSCEIIEGYGNQILAVLKNNRGQASAFNTGVAMSSGDVIIFLDSDDVLLPTAIEKSIRFFKDPTVAKVHWPLAVINEYGKQSKRIVPSRRLDEGNLIDVVRHVGPNGYAWPPTSGNAWSRSFIDSVFPIQEDIYKICPDLYLSALVPLYGLIKRVSEPQALWRIHGKNASWQQSLDERVQCQVRLWEHCFQSLESCGKEKGIQIDLQELRANSWWHKIDRTIEEIVALLPAGEKLILVDEGQWGPGSDIAGRHCIPFPEKNGQYWGLPANDQDAIEETERLRQAGANIMAIVWPSFWWLEYYTGLNQYLRCTYACLIENERVVIFDLKSASNIRTERGKDKR
jgi:hypothetical protein